MKQMEWFNWHNKLTAVMSENLNNKKKSVCLFYKVIRMFFRWNHLFVDLIAFEWNTEGVVNIEINQFTRKEGKRYFQKTKTSYNKSFHTSVASNIIADNIGFKIPTFLKLGL